MDTPTPTHISNQYINELINDFYNNVLKESILSFYNSTTEKSLEMLMDFIYYDLYSKYGIKRKIIADNAVMLNYSKNHPKYSKDIEILNLFRSVIINPKTMEIVSLGLPKSSSSIVIDNTLDFSTIQCENFNYGTMIIYNKDKTFTFTTEDSEEKEDNVENVEKEVREIDASISTRTKIGTSNFNTDFSHRFYFEQNNLSNPKNVIDLNEIPDEYKNCSFVFNMTHKREHLCNVSMNTLVACYKFNLSLDYWEPIVKIILESKADDMSKEEHLKNEDLIASYLKTISSEMLVALDLKVVQDDLVKAGVGYIPIPTKLEFKSLEDALSYVNEMPITEQGIILWLPDGRRTKIRNLKFSYVKSLCMNCSINPSPINQKNLFKMYWELNKVNKIPEFLKYYETPDYRYNFIFNYFHFRINTMINHLFQVYQQLHVMKNLSNEMVPKFMKPLCYSLHGLYLADKKPITKERVAHFIYEMNFGNLYGRIFTPIL